MSDFTCCPDAKSEAISDVNTGSVYIQCAGCGKIHETGPSCWINKELGLALTSADVLGSWTTFEVAHGFISSCSSTT